MCEVVSVSVSDREDVRVGVFVCVCGRVCVCVFVCLCGRVEKKEVK